MKSDNKKQGVVSISAPANKVDFMDLWNLLVQRKTAVISVAIITFFIIVLNSHFNSSSPIYSVSAILAPPTESDLDGTNFLLLNHGTSPLDVFIVFEQALKSRALRIRYFNNNNLIEQFEIDNNFDNEYVFEQQFNKMLSVKRMGERSIVSFNATDARVAAESVNGFIEMVNEYVVRELNQVSELKIENYKKEIEKLTQIIEDKRMAAKLERENRISQLEEMILIADFIEMNDLNDWRHPSIYPRYMMGSKVLQVEANILRQRENDEPFIEGLIIVELKLKDLIFGLEELETTRPHISAMNFVRKATISAQPVNKPGGKTFLLTAVLSSLVLGMLAGFFTDFTARARKRRDSSSNINM
jgi:LPS O-antigen subunit length determinant protein (WzzB/FepE family)